MHLNKKIWDPNKNAYKLTCGFYTAYTHVKFGKQNRWAYHTFHFNFPLSITKSRPLHDIRRDKKETTEV